MRAPLMAAARARGWRCAVPHFRGCSGEPNRAPRVYHSGDAEKSTGSRAACASAPAGRLFAVGVSLGGNALLRWLGKRSTRPRSSTPPARCRRRSTSRPAARRFARA